MDNPSNFSKEYVSDNETSKPVDVPPLTPTIDIQRYSTSKPRRSILKAKLIHD